MRRHFASSLKVAMVQKHQIGPDVGSTPANLQALHGGAIEPRTVLWQPQATARISAPAAFAALYGMSTRQSSSVAFWLNQINLNLTLSIPAGKYPVG